MLFYCKHEDKNNFHVNLSSFLWHNLLSLLKCSIVWVKVGWRWRLRGKVKELTTERMQEIEMKSFHCASLCKWSVTIYEMVPVTLILSYPFLDKLMPKCQLLRSFLFLTWLHYKNKKNGWEYFYWYITFHTFSLCKT